MAVEIREVTKGASLKSFIYLPEKIHANHPQWLHPLYSDDHKFFDASKNRLFRHHAVKLWIAVKDGIVVGRIMGIIPTDYNQMNGENNVRFSFMETYDDYEVFEALLNAVVAWGKLQGCTGMVGPLGFSDKDPQGFLLEGFDQPTVMVTNCSFPYMIDLSLKFGLKTKLDLFEYRFPVTNELLQRMEPFAQRALQYQDLVMKEFTNTWQIRPYIVPVFELMNKTYQNIYGFAPYEEQEMKEFANRYLPLLDPKLIKIILNSKGQLLAFVIAMADLSQGIRAARGRLFPLGWWKILKSGRQTNTMMLMLGAVHENYRSRGLDSVMGIQLLKSALQKGYIESDSHLIMETNLRMRAEIERIEGHRLIKKYRIFEMPI
jgi:hypothetical protein